MSIKVVNKVTKHVYKLSVSCKGIKAIVHVKGAKQIVKLFRKPMNLTDNQAKKIINQHLLNN